MNMPQRPRPLLSAAFFLKIGLTFAYALLTILYMSLTEHFGNLGVDYLVTRQPTPSMLILRILLFSDS
jgi:hypothetical protein